MVLADDILTSLRTSIHTILVAALPVGTQVHDYFRLTTTDAALRAVMVSTDDRLHAWMVSLSEGDTGVGIYLGSSQEQIRFRWALHGWLAVNDADESEMLWEAEVTKVIKAFQAAPKLNRGTGGGGDVIDSGPIQIDSISYRRVPPETGALCHYALLSYSVLVQARP